LNGLIVTLSTPRFSEFFEILFTFKRLCVHSNEIEVWLNFIKSNEKKLSKHTPLWENISGITS